MPTIVNRCTSITGNEVKVRRCLECIPELSHNLTGFNQILSLAAGLLFTALVLMMSTGAAFAQSQPVIVGAGTYSVPHELSMSTSSGTIYYTTDGSAPTTGSTAYSAPFLVTQSAQIKAVSYLGGRYSPVTTAYFNIEPGTPLLWLNGQAGVGTSPGTPPSVNSWDDQSGNGLDATHTTGGAPGLYTSSINGLASVGFSGSQCLTLPSGFSNFSSGASLFVVLRPSALTADSKVIDLGTGSSGNNVLIQISTSGSYGQLSVFDGTSGTNVQTGTALASGSFQLLEAVLIPDSPNATATCYLNGVEGSTNASMNNIPTITRTDNFIGQASDTGDFFEGNIAELLLYARPLSAAERFSIESYLLQKYQIATQAPNAPKLSLPTGILSGPTQLVIAADADAATYITRDGSTPSSSSEVYNGVPITINYSQTIKAVSIKNGITSSVADSTYTLDSSQWPAPSSGDTTAPSINLQLPVQSQ